MTKIRVVVVDDSALVRSLLTEIINRQSDMQCVGAAADPLVAREMIRELNPDVITLDVEMPRMDGLEFLSRLMRLRPMPVVMVSTLTEQGADITLRALEMGAVDYVAKPRIGITSGLNELAHDIVDKIRIAAGAHVKRLPAATAVPPPPPRAAMPPQSRRAHRCRAWPPPKNHLHRRLHRRHRSHPRSAGAHAGRCAGHRHHPAHAAGLHHQFCRTAEQPVPHQRGRGAPR